MTISSTNNRNDYTGNDTTAIYNYSFRVFLESDLTVTVRNTTTDVETELSLTTDYTVQDVGELSGGTITLVDAGQDWISGTSNLDTGYKLTIRRIVGLTQNTDIRNQGDFFPEVHEDAFDRLTMTDQQQQDDLDRAIKLPETIASSEFDTTIPADFVGTQSLALVSNATGDGFATGPSISAIEGAQAAATAAAASAAAAATSETNAGTSETNAATSETNAATSETNAAVSAAAASTSETNAATSASNAATSETNAGTSETNAAASAAAASTSETNAATSASNAATSETNAATSASNAATSETNAATSATNAATSEANAAASATAAQDAAAASQWKDVVYITNVDSPVSITDADSGKLYSVNTSGGNVVFNLPAISVLTLSNPWSIGIKKTDTSANTVTINPNGTDVIDGNASATISQAETGLVVIPDADPAPDEWTTLIFGEVPSVFEGKTFNDEITMKEIATPSAPAAGFQAIFMDSGDNKLKRIDSNGDVFGVGGGAGDADTIHLIKASDQGASQITQYSVDSALPNFDGTTAFGVNEGDISVPTSGSEALLSNENDHKVYKFTSESASQYSAWGMNLAIPRYIRGEDVVLQFKYRTADTSGDSQNADYMPWVYDQTNGVNTTFNDTPGTFAAGSSIILTTTAGMAVGDKIWVGEAAGVVETHITAIPVAGTVQLADEVTCAAGARFVTGILTDVLTTLDAADDDTNKTGNDFKVVFNVPSTCASVALLFQQLTSQTDSFLYVDNILISSEVVKRVFARGRSKTYIAYEAQSTVSNRTNELQFSGSVVETIESGFADLITVDHSSDPSTWTAKVPCEVKIDVNAGITGANDGLCILKNGTIVQVGSSAPAANTLSFAGTTLTLAKDDYVTVSHCDSTGAQYGGTITSVASQELRVNITATPLVNDVVVVESTDSVISEWTDFTPTGLWTTNTTYTGKWRRVGDTMQVSVNASLSGAPNAGNMYFDLPSGYVIDTSKLPDTTVGIGFLGSGTAHDNGTGSQTIEVRYKDTSSVYVTPRSGSSYVSTTVPFTWASGDDLNAYFEVPIAGWDANPKPLLAFPTITYGQDAEYAHATDIGGYSSNNLAIPYFNNVHKNTISNLGTLSPSDSSDGAIFTATKRCKVTYTLWLDSTTDTIIGFSKNATATEMDSNINTGVDQSRVLCLAQPGAGIPECVTVSHILEPGEYIAPHLQTGETFGGTAAYQGISILVEPEEGQVNQAAIISQPVAFVREEQPTGTNGGTFTAGSWQTRTLNTLRGDIAAVGVTLSSNQFTLPAGRYCIEARSPVNSVNQHKCKLYNVTDSTDSIIGSSEYANSTNAIANDSKLSGVVTITKPTTFSLQHYCVTTKTTDGLGVTFNSAGAKEVYAEVKITRKK